MSTQPRTRHARLYATIEHLLEGSKGLLAADESTRSANKRLESLGITPSEEIRRQWRELLFTTPRLNDFISGVILYDETIYQRDSHGHYFSELLCRNGIIPGIKVDTGLVKLTNFSPDTTTEGLDGLAARLEEYYHLGARFAKWRAAFSIGASTPSEAAIHANGNSFGRYAALCQAQGIVPIIEPEVLYDGHHSIETAQNITTHILKTTMEIVRAYRVDLKGVIVKTSMVLAGKHHHLASSPEQVAKATLATLKASIPEEVGAVVFLSGGQAPTQATTNFNAICIQAMARKAPWPLTYSFSRAVQDPVMKSWDHKSSQTQHAQNIFYHRLACNSAAREGQYTPAMEIFKNSRSK